jgi:hypothetical protein
LRRSASPPDIAGPIQAREATLRKYYAKQFETGHTRMIAHLQTNLVKGRGALLQCQCMPVW